MGTAPLDRITPVSIEKLKDSVFENRGRDFTNKLLSVMSLTFNFGIRHGHCSLNPVEKIRKIPRDKSLPKPNRPWTNEEIATVLFEARPEIAAGIGLGAYTALRGVDMLSLTWNTYAEGAIFYANNQKRVTRFEYLLLVSSPTSSTTWTESIRELSSIRAGSLILRAVFKQNFRNSKNAY